MTFLSYAYRFLSNFVFWRWFISADSGKIPAARMVAVLVLVCRDARASALIVISSSASERLEGGAAPGGDAAEAGRCIRFLLGRRRGQLLRHAGEMKSYIDLLFLALVIRCIAKIATIEDGQAAVRQTSEQLSQIGI
jgi:hypothetical protein